MIESVEEGLERYKEAIRKYLKFRLELENKYGHEDLTGYDAEDWNEIVKVESQLSAAANVLGLTEEEQSLILSEIEKGDRK